LAGPCSINEVGEEAGPVPAGVLDELLLDGPLASPGGGVRALGELVPPVLSSGELAPALLEASVPVVVSASGLRPHADSNTAPTRQTMTTLPLVVVVFISVLPQFLISDRLRNF
jgi:hypothetical protein